MKHTRRSLLFAALAMPLAAWTPQPGRKYRIGIGFFQGDELTRRLTAVIRERLAVHGFVEGRNLAIHVTTDACCGEHYAREKARAVLGLTAPHCGTAGRLYQAAPPCARSFGRGGCGARRPCLLWHGFRVHRQPRRRSTRARAQRR
jgi:hypothetical protein